MRTKLFLAFFAVIVVALVSNLIYEHFISRDFEDYVSGTKEDKLYWVLANVEGSYADGDWDTRALQESLHWAMMLGFDVSVSNFSGKEITTTRKVIEHLSPSMKRRMKGIIDIADVRDEYEPYPLYQGGREIGTLAVRPLKRSGSIDEKESIFKKRGREFLTISFIIAGGGALFLSFFFAIFISRPLNKMKNAVDSFAQGDFRVRVPVESTDEVGRLAKSFNFMAEALQREEALRKHLTSNIAHELRTPLSIMKANVEAMIDGIVTDKAEGLDNVRMEVEKLIGLVEGIEDVTKAEASYFSKRANVDISLSAFIGNIIAKMQPLAFAKNLTIELISANPVFVETDIDKLEAIEQNIITNAIRNTATGGIRIDYGIEKNFFFIAVHDTGIGVPEDKQQLIFKRFYRGEDSMGIGLGLAIVKELIDTMGGRIDLKSTPGKGSTFTVWLPTNKKT
jgi:two-component system sensor histidine kinase BaeS